MLSFVTEFPVESGRTSSDFVAAIQEWILGSPHTRLKASDFAALIGGQETSVRRDIESVEFLRVHIANEDAAGIRYVRTDSGLEWVTTVVFSGTANESWVGIRVSCEASHPTVRLPVAKKPVVVRTLLQNLGGGIDGDLSVTGVPIFLSNSDIELAARLIGGAANCRLPIVYVSASFQGQHLVDSRQLASNLTGMAHVVVEPNRQFSLRLKIDVDSENVYGGAIGVYWPDSGGRRAFYLGKHFETSDEAARAIFEDVRVALTNRRALARCTWAYIQEAKSREALSALRASGSHEIERYIESFDDEIAAKDQRLADAEQEIARLRSELRAYEVRLPAVTSSPLRTGGEQDLYPNEVFSILRAAVEDARTRVPTDSRRQHVLDALLRANPAREDISGQMRGRLKQLLRGSRGMDAKMRRGLEDLGFEISEEGKHFKLIFRGDERYTFTLPKTGSDHRGGLNAASDIARLLL